MRRVALLLVAAFAFTSSVEAAPAAKSKRTAAASARAKRAKHPPWFKGANAPKSEYRTEPLERPSGDLWIRAENLDEEVKVHIYNADGSFDNEALGKLDDLFRCVRSGEVRAMRAELYEHLSRVQDHFGGKRIDLVSGFRYPERTSSRHHHASAVDFRVQGVSIYEIRKYAATLDTGNMGLGIYPTSGFVHLDYRAPGEPSFRWTDYSGPNGGKRSKKKTGRTQPARKPVS
ncbi:MAG TPA: DUF882 domain-containing protein [Kofleriaceae bacterium]|nr:DUF882 domain-containing protein [Kofleriaceae bacterium]